MIVEQDRIKQNKEDLKKEREFRSNVIRKAEIYERLASNRDFREYLDDVANRAKAHKECIEAYVAQLGQPVTDANEAEHPIMRRSRIADLISFHEAQRSVCEELSTMPDRVSSMKEEAMIRLNEIDELEKEINHGTRKAN